MNTPRTTFAPSTQCHKTEAATYQLAVQAVSNPQAATQLLLLAHAATIYHSIDAAGTASDNAHHKPDGNEMNASPAACSPWGTWLQPRFTDNQKPQSKLPK